MEYLITSLVKENAKEYHDSLFKKLDEKFHLKVPISNKPPSHITLKNSFETDNIKMIENIISAISKKTKSSEVFLTDFNHFRNKEILFIKIEESKEFSQMQKEIVTDLSRQTNLIISNKDRNQRFHLTLAFPKIFNNLDSIWKYMKELNKPNIKTSINNISILKKEEGIWKIHKEFSLL
ncbi:MAG: 2'-5' RNA ligase family protein [Nanoarchaeota archaeon]|nr:2'-5' RNA ligase family protein [Nanoarchaeota archaeon]